MARIAVTLVDIQQLDYVEAAEVMGVPKEGLKCFLSFGRARFDPVGVPFELITSG